MDAKLKNKWIKALRSGKFKQGLLKLVSSDKKYCCLGVLCVVGKFRGWRRRYNLPDRIAKKVFGDAGLNNGKEVHIKGVKNELASHNDNGATFKEIADAIEKQL